MREYKQSKSATVCCFSKKGKRNHESERIKQDADREKFAMSIPKINGKRKA